MTERKEHYENLDGIRALACTGILMMHIYANGNFGLSGFLFEKLIPSFTDLVFLFMLISAFSMCCGYYEKFQNGTINLEIFYIRRYERIWPFFAFLCTLELIINHSINSLYEWFADLTLAFGLMPNANISVVGVGWFLGVIFVFYMVFPFFVFLIGNKKRAWIVLGVSMILTGICRIYFFNEDHVIERFNSRNNFLYCLMFFVAGGIVYLYRLQLKNLLIRFEWILLIASGAMLFYYYFINNIVFVLLPLFSFFTVLGIIGEGGISALILQNKVVRFIGSLSMEIYLCHMFVYRTLEKCEVLHITRNEVVNYLLICILTFCGAIIFAYISKELLQKILLRRKG